jgi:hypothetical protein
MILLEVLDDQQDEILFLEQVLHHEEVFHDLKICFLVVDFEVDEREDKM